MRSPALWNTGSWTCAVSVSSSSAGRAKAPMPKCRSWNKTAVSLRSPSRTSSYRSANSSRSAVSSVRSAGVHPYQVMLDGEYRGTGAVADARLGVDMLDVVLHGTRREHQPLGDLLVGEP